MSDEQKELQKLMNELSTWYLRRTVDICQQYATQLTQLQTEYLQRESELPARQGEAALVIALPRVEYVNGRVSRVMRGADRQANELTAFLQAMSESSV